MSDEFLKRVKVVKKTGSADTSNPTQKPAPRVVNDSQIVSGERTVAGKISHYAVNESVEINPNKKK